MEIITFNVKNNESITEITDALHDYVRRNRIKDGLMMLQAPEKNVGITFADADDPTIEKEYLGKMNRILPKYDGMQFTGWSTPGIKAAFIGQSMQIMVQNGCLILGIHQGVFAADFAGPAGERSLFVSHLGTTLAQDEEAALPQILEEMNERIMAEEAAEAAEQERLIEEMRKEYADRQKKLTEDPQNVDSDRQL